MLAQMLIQNALTFKMEFAGEIGFHFEEQVAIMVQSLRSKCTQISYLQFVRDTKMHTSHLSKPRFCVGVVNV